MLDLPHPKSSKLSNNPDIKAEVINEVNIKTIILRKEYDTKN